MYKTTPKVIYKDEPIEQKPTEPEPLTPVRMDPKEARILAGIQEK